MTLQLRPTFSESWYRVQGLRPKLRAGAQISRQFYRGERWYVVRDPAGNQYHRLSDVAYMFVGLLDGTRTVGEAWELVGGQLADDAPTQPEVIQILSQLYSANLIETNIPPDAQVLLRRHRKQMVQKAKGRLMNILFPRIPLLDPDWILKAWLPLMRPILSPAGGIVWLTLVIAALVFTLPHLDELRDWGAHTINFTANPENAVLLYASFVLLKIIHEFGHGFFCRRFGGEVHEMGIMFLVLFPAPYVDASSAWSFPNKWHRILVGAGGMIFENFVAAIACFIWLATRGDGYDSLVPALAYNVMLIASVSTLLFNANPLLRYDGYYMLSDLLEIPNLQFRSREYTLGLVKRHLFRVKTSQPLPAPSQRPYLVLYYLTSGPYRIFIGFAIMIMVLYQLPRELQIVGLVLGLGSLATFFLIPIFKLFKYLTVEPELHRKRLRAWAYVTGTAAALLILLAFIPFSLRVRASGVIETRERAAIFPTTPGFVSEVHARDGQVVKAGDIILVSRNDELEAQIRILEAQVRQARLRLDAALAEEPASVELARQELELYQKQLAREQARNAELTIRAPIDGKLIAPDIQNIQGSFLQPGQAIAQVLADGPLVVKALITQKESELLTNADGRYQTEIRPVGDIFNTVSIDEEDALARTRVIPRANRQAPGHQLTQAGGGEFAVDPSDSTGLTLAESAFEFRIYLPESKSEFVPGQRAYIRIKLQEKRSLVWMGWRKLLQLIQTTRAT